jgi:hypothetical protein
MKRLPEDGVNTSKYVGVFYEIDITVILCICWRNNKLHTVHGTYIQ